VKRYLRKIHRWLGAALCALFAVWFSSGIVMSFQGYPDYSPEDRLRAATSLRLAAPAQLVPALLTRVPGTSANDARLSMLGAIPAWRIDTEQGHTKMLHADTGAPLVLSDREVIAAALANAGIFRLDPAARIERLFQPDQWTLYPSVRAALPLLHVSANDAAETELYVSLLRAEVVQKTTGRSRLVAWCGAIPHWLYLRVLVTSRGVWRQLVICLAAAAVIACVAGIVLGVWNWRPRRRYRANSNEASSIPYRTTWLRLHHLLGLSFGSVAFSYVFSGMLSLQPFGWAGSNPVSKDLRFRLSGGPLVPSRFTLPLQDALQACREHVDVKEIVLAQVGTVPFYLCLQSIGRSRVVRADQQQAVVREQVSAELVKAAIGSTGSIGPHFDTLYAYDSYYRPNHFYPALALPVLRVRWHDSVDTWDYVDLTTARFVRRFTTTTRLERWLYNGLHSLDFSWLYNRRWLWHSVVVAFCMGGFSLSCSGVILALRWLKRERRRQQKSAPLA